MEEDYNVVFRYTRAAGGYHGVIIWSSFASREAFDKWYTEDVRARQEIVEEGVTRERAIEFVHQTPRACHIAVAMQEATDAEGNINQEILESEMRKIAYMEVVADEQVADAAAGQEKGLPRIRRTLAHQISEKAAVVMSGKDWHKLTPKEDALLELLQAGGYIIPNNPANGFVGKAACSV